MDSRAYQKDADVLGIYELDDAYTSRSMAEKMDSPAYQEDVGLLGNYDVLDAETSRLMASALAASIPTDDEGFSEDSEESEDGMEKLMAAAQAAAIPSDDDSLGENSEDERDKLMAAALAAAIPSDDDSLSDNSHDEMKKLMGKAHAAAIPTDDSFNDQSEDSDDEMEKVVTAAEAVVKSGDLEKSRVMEAAQATAIPSDDSFSDASDYYDRTRIMTAAQAVSIPSDDSFSEDSMGGSSEHTRSTHFSKSGSASSKFRRESSMRVASMVTKARIIQQYLDSDDSSGFLSGMSDSERSSMDSLAKVNPKAQTAISEMRRRKNDPKVQTVGEILGMEVDDYGLVKREYTTEEDESDLAPKKNQVNSASFSAVSTSFKWAGFKTKIFYSFRALKGGGSSTEGSRTISVKNLGSNVTDEELYRFFDDSSAVSDIQIVPDPKSGLCSAYVEFDTADAASKAVRKSGKKLDGRVVFCDYAYENSRLPHSKDYYHENSSSGKGNSRHPYSAQKDYSHENSSSGKGNSRSIPQGDYSFQKGERSRDYSHEKSNSGKGKSTGIPQGHHSFHKEKRSPAFSENLVSVNDIVDQSMAALAVFQPELHQGDAKFLRCFSDNFDYSSYGDFHEATDYSSLKLIKRGEPEVADKRLALQPSRPSVDSDTYTDLLLAPGRPSVATTDLDHSVYFDAENLEGNQMIPIETKVPTPRRSWLQWRRRRPKDRMSRFLLPWHARPRWQWWQFAKQSAVWVRRKASFNRKSTKKVVLETRSQKSREASVYLPC